MIDCEGIEMLFDQIPVRLKQSNIETIGIIIYADSDLLTRWKKIKQIFFAQGINLPDELPDSGLIINESDQIAIGIWIMPNNDLNGMLEDFITFLVPQKDRLMPIITENLNEIERKQLNRYNPIHRSKAVIHSWLSVQENPGTPMGLGITKRYLTTENEKCIVLIDWLKRLFQE